MRMCLSQLPTRHSLKRAPSQGRLFSFVEERQRFLELLLMGVTGFVDVGFGALSGRKPDAAPFPTSARALNRCRDICGGGLP